MSLNIIAFVDSLQVLEQALQLKDQHPGSTVKVLAVGGDSCGVEFVRESLYRGVDKGIVLASDVWFSADVSAMLVAAIRKMGGCDVIVCGSKMELIVKPVANELGITPFVVDNSAVTYRPRNAKCLLTHKGTSITEWNSADLRPHLLSDSVLSAQKYSLSEIAIPNETIQHNPQTPINEPTGHEDNFSAHNLKNASIVIAGGHGVGSRENFRLLFELARELHAEVGATRAAVDAGFVSHERMIGQTGLTVHPKVYMACGISGNIQHTAGMKESELIVSINTDVDAPINSIADIVIIGRVEEVLPKMIKYYKMNSHG